MFFKIFIILVIIIILILIYFLGNVIEGGKDLNFEYNILYYNNNPVDINNIEEYVNFKENLTDNLIQNRRKEIVWFDNKKKTNTVLYFLHGFNSDKTEGNNFSLKLAKELNSNLLLARLPGNGVYNKETSYNNLNVYHYLREVYNDLILLSILGQQIILIGSSTGCTYNIISTVLFKNKFNIFKNIFFSPNLGLNFYENIGIKFLYSGYGKSIIKLTTDKIKIDNYLVSPDLFVPLIGSLKLYDSIEKDFKNDFIIFISEKDELVSNGKVNTFFNNKKDVKKHYYIYKDRKIHPILFLDKSGSLFLEKTLYFLNTNSEPIIKEYVN